MMTCNMLSNTNSDNICEIVVKGQTYAYSYALNYAIKSIHMKGL